jgi:hypothetical protein
VVGRPIRTVRWRRIRHRSRLQEDSGVSGNPQPSQPRYPLIRIDVTFTLPRRLVWLLAGIAISNLHLPDGLLEKTSILLQALLSAFRHRY